VAASRSSTAARVAPWAGATALVVVAVVLLYLFTGAAATEAFEAPPVTATDIAFGPEDAPVTVIEYSDFQCPFCAEYAKWMTQLREKYGDQVRFVAQHPAPQRALMAIARVGAHFPAYSLASGKVLLAQLSEDEVVRRLPRRLEPALDGRQRTRETLLRELDEVRASGLGFEREEMRHGICAVAVAVTDVDGRAASVAVPMPTARFVEGEEQVAARLLELRDTTEARLRGS